MFCVDWSVRVNSAKTLFAALRGVVFTYVMRVALNPLLSALCCHSINMSVGIIIAIRPVFVRSLSAILKKRLLSRLSL